MAVAAAIAAGEWGWNWPPSGARVANNDVLVGPPHVRFFLDFVAKLSLRRCLSRDSVDQDVIRGSGR